MQKLRNSAPQSWPVSSKLSLWLHATVVFWTFTADYGNEQILLPCPGVVSPTQPPLLTPRLHNYCFMSELLILDLTWLNLDHGACWLRTPRYWLVVSRHQAMQCKILFPVPKRSVSNVIIHCNCPPPHGESPHLTPRLDLNAANK